MHPSFLKDIKTTDIYVNLLQYCGTVHVTCMYTILLET